MDMQDIDYELVYKPEKDEEDPLDFLSRHLLPILGSDNTEKVIKSIINAEHAVVLDHKRLETSKDKQLQKLQWRIIKKDWKNHRKDTDIYQFYSIRKELYVVNGLILD